MKQSNRTTRLRPQGPTPTGGSESERHLKTETQKAKTDEHGGILSDEYLSYAVTDVQATWECYLALSERFNEHDLGLKIRSC
jgi:hypothetical protein